MNNPHHFLNPKDAGAAAELWNREVAYLFTHGWTRSEETLHVGFNWNWVHPNETGTFSVDSAITRTTLRQFLAGELRQPEPIGRNRDEKYDLLEPIDRHTLVDAIEYFGGIQSYAGQFKLSPHIVANALFGEGVAEDVLNILHDSIGAYAHARGPITP